MERLADHTNADDQSAYREAEEILDSSQGSDPIVALASELGALGVSAAQRDEIGAQVRAQVQEAAARAREALSNIANSALGAQLSQLLIVASDRTAIVEVVPGAPGFKARSSGTSGASHSPVCG